MKPLDWTGTTDAELVIAAAVGDLGAFDELVRRYRPAVLSVARQVAGSEAADDLAQDALILAYKALPQLDEPERFGSWLYAITRHRAMRFAQHPARREKTGHSPLDRQILEEAPALSPGPEATVEREESGREVLEALAQLPEAFRLVLRLRYFDAVPVARIGEFLNLPLTTVKWRLHRGRQLMKGHLELRWRETPRARKETSDERRAERPEAGSAPAGADAGRHHQDGPRGQPHRAVGRRPDRRDPSVQRGCSAP
jgi:RNA polymerase sigma-70 factor (ECF subfamily)